MKNIRLITSREYLSQIRKRTFILMTVFSPLLVIILMGVAGFIFKANESTLRVAVIDENNLFHTSLKNTSEVIYYHHTKKELNKLINSLPKNEELDAILYLPSTKDSLLSSIEKNCKLYFAKNISKTATYTIKNQLEDKIKQIRLLSLGINDQEYNQIQTQITFKEINLKDGIENQKEESSSLVKEIFSYILMYITFMFIMIYGTRVMRNILEEKNNRVVEIIISSVKPFELMMGKILGTALVAITQFVIWILMTLIALVVLQFFIDTNQTSEILKNTPQNEFIDLNNLQPILNSLWSLNYPLIIVVFLFNFFIGYLFYSSFFAAIGSAVDSETETSQFTPLVIIPLSMAVYGSISIINNPEGPIGFWLSIFPITAPVVMNARISFGVPIWEILLSALIMIISTLAMMYLAAKIYRTGILMYGKKINLKELWKWIRYN